MEPKASYGNIAKDGGERVVHVSPDRCTVVTVIGNRRVTYLGVRHPTIAEGDMLEEPLKHRTRTIAVAWDPFDGDEDDGE